MRGIYKLFDFCRPGLLFLSLLLLLGVPDPVRVQPPGQLPVAGADLTRGRLRVKTHHLQNENHLAFPHNSHPKKIY